jgi:hypothetical protein
MGGQSSRLNRLINAYHELGDNIEVHSINLLASQSVRKRSLHDTIANPVASSILSVFYVLLLYDICVSMLYENSVCVCTR